MVWLPTCKLLNVFYISQMVFLNLSRWNGAKKLLELVTWCVLLPRPGQQLADSFLVAPLRVRSQLVERLSGLFIGCSNLQG